MDRFRFPACFSFRKGSRFSQTQVSLLLKLLNKRGISSSCCRFHCGSSLCYWSVSSCSVLPFLKYFLRWERRTDWRVKVPKKPFSLSDQMEIFLLISWWVTLLFQARLAVARKAKPSVLVLDVALSEVAEDSIDAPVLSAAVVDALYFFLSIPVQLSCSSYGSYKRRSVKASNLHWSGNSNKSHRQQALQLVRNVRNLVGLDSSPSQLSSLRVLVCPFPTPLALLIGMMTSKRKHISQSTLNRQQQDQPKQ